MRFVVGGGLSGIAAALSARALGVDVMLARGRSGATVLSSGAWDLAGWNATHGDRDPVPGAAIELLSQARAPVTFGDALVITTAGIVRSARGRDVQVLGLPSDLLTRSNRFGTILVPRVQVGTWDADAIATSLDELLRPAGHAGARAIDATLVRHRDELRAPLADLARAHDEIPRVDWLIARLREALASFEQDTGAIVLPPMLGIDEASIARVRAAFSVPIGEALGDPGGPAALRYLRWTDRALNAAGVRLVDGEVTHVAEGAVQVRGGESRAHAASHVVLATGGVEAGGLIYGTREHEEGGIFPASARASLRLGLTIGGADVVPVLERSAIDPASSLFGLEGDRMLLGRSPALKRAGLSVDDRGTVLDRRGATVPWLFAAGDAIADAPRTAITAVVSGMRAGSSAAS